MLEASHEVASAISIGGREHQEDAIIVDFPKGSDLGYVVLADGMGGHAAGDIASKLVVTEVFSDLKLYSGDFDYFEENITDILMQAAHTANECVRDQTAVNPNIQGMGSTLVAPVILGQNLYWISIGDSPLFLFRDAKLTRLNDNHSMAPQIDFMAKSGLMTEEARRTHPDRNCLSSGLVGREIRHIDCPTTPTILKENDIVIVASDGLNSLMDEEIETVLQAHGHRSSAEVVDILMHQVEAIDDPEQDNVALSVIKVKGSQTEHFAIDPSQTHKKEFEEAAMLLNSLPNQGTGRVTNFFFFNGVPSSQGKS
jgi:protein phosphatase